MVLDEDDEPCAPDEGNNCVSVVCHPPVALQTCRSNPKLSCFEVSKVNGERDIVMTTMNRVFMGRITFQ